MRDATTRPAAVRILLENNLPSSITRIAADTASAFAAWGIKTTVLFPVVDWLEFKRFEISRLPWSRKWRWMARLILEAVTNAWLRRRWCGLRHHTVHPAVRTERYLMAPRCSQALADEITVVHHTYVTPRILRGYARHGMKLVGVIHNNYEREVQSPWPEAAAWKAYCVELERRLAMPRVATSQGGRRSAERLGIPIQRVIPNGLDLRLFQPAPTRRQEGPLRVLLYCDPNVQKGQREGVEALRALASRGPALHFCSLGHVLPECASVFHHQYGYLHGAAYAEALRASDIFVYPSLYDGFPAPPLQAMACGAALVTTAVEGVVDYAVDGDNCLLCEPGNVAMMQAQLLHLIEDGALRERLQRQGPKTAQAYSVEYTAKAWLAFLGTLSNGAAASLSAEANA